MILDSTLNLRLLVHELYTTTASPTTVWTAETETARYQGLIWKSSQNGISLDLEKLEDA
jgi:hypothetical protein